MDANMSSAISPPACTFSLFTLLDSHGQPTTTTMVSSAAPPFVPMLAHHHHSHQTYSWTPSNWHGSFENNYSTNVNYVVNEQQQQQSQQPVEWYEYESSSHSYEFYDPENMNIEHDDPIAADWGNIEDWIYDLTSEEDEYGDYPSKFLQRLAWDTLQSIRHRSYLHSQLEYGIETADVCVWQKLFDTQNDQNQKQIDQSTTTIHDQDQLTNFQSDQEIETDGNGKDEHTKDGQDDDNEIKIVIPDTLPPIPTCDTLLLPPEIGENNSTPAPISYAAASTPRNAAETIGAYMNRVVKMHLIAANTPMTDTFPFRHRDAKIVDGHTTIGDIGSGKDTNSANIIVQSNNSLEAMAAMARRNSFALRQLNGGLLLIPVAQDEHRYCIGASTAGRMLIGLEKLSPPRMYASDFRTICLKKVPYTEDCDKVWCRLNLFRKQIGAERSAARRNNVAVYELFARPDQFAYFGRIPYKWNLDEYLKSDHYTTNVMSSQKEGLRILRGIVNGLAYVHRGDFRLFHGNLKPSNVLLSSDGSIFLTDYGFGRICCPMWSGAAAHRYCRESDTGTFDPLCWKAYEFFSGCGPAATSIAIPTSPTLARETPHRQADVFSAALLGYYAITAGQSHPLIDGDEAYRKTLHFYRQRVDRFADFVHLNDVVDPSARRLIGSMLEIDVKQRPDARYVADHPAFWNEKKRNEFLNAVAELVCAGEKMIPNGGNAGSTQTSALLRILSNKKISTFDFARRLNLTPENVAKIAVRFGVKFEDASATIALKTFYRQNRRTTTTTINNSNGGQGEKSTIPVDELEPLWSELAAEIYDVAYPSPPIKLKQFFTK